MTSGSDNSSLMRYFRLTSDINLDGHYWSAVIAKNITLDGDGRSIKNMCVSGDTYGGFIRYSGGYSDSQVLLKNVVFDSADINVSNNYAGVIVADNYSMRTLTIENVCVKNSSVKLTITTNAPSNSNAQHLCVGSIAGRSNPNMINCDIYNTSVVGSFASSSLTGWKLHIGGIAGYLSGQIKNVNMCLNTLSAGTNRPSLCNCSISPIGASVPSLWSYWIGDLSSWPIYGMSISIENYDIPSASTFYAYSLLATRASTLFIGNKSTVSNAVVVNRMYTSSTSLPSNFTTQAIASNTSPVYYHESTQYINTIFKNAFASAGGYTCLPSRGTYSSFFRMNFITKAFQYERMVYELSTDDQQWGTDLLGFPSMIGPKNTDCPGGLSSGMVSYIVLSTYGANFYTGDDTGYDALFPAGSVTLPFSADGRKGVGDVWGFSYGEDSTPRTSDTLMQTDCRSGDVIRRTDYGKLIWVPTLFESNKSFNYKKDSSTIVEGGPTYFKNSSGNLEVSDKSYKKDSSTVV